MKAVRNWLSGHAVAVVATLSLLGCGGESTSSSDGSGNARGGSASGGTAGARGGSTGNGGATDGTIFLEDPNNYTVSSELRIPTIETAPEDLTICWSEATTDLACQEVDPEADVETIAFFTFRRESDGIAELLNDGEISMSDFEGVLQHSVERPSTCTELSSFTNFGTEVDIANHYVERPDGSYLLWATRGAELGVGSVSMAFVRPVSSSANREVNLPAGCGIQELLVDLEEADPVHFPYDASGLVDYRNLTRNGRGNSLPRIGLDRLVLSFFAGVTLSDLETRILELDAIATESFELELTGSTSVSLYSAISPETGREFDGFRRLEAGIWLLRLLCTTCSNVVPEVVVVLEPF